MKRMMPLIALLLVGACSPLTGIVTSDERRVWVTRGSDLYRCADAALADEPPRPVCMRTIFTKPRSASTE